MTDHPRSIQQSISVNWDFPVTFTHGLFRPTNRVLVDTLRRLGEERRHRVMVFLDSHVATARPELVAEITAYFSIHSTLVELAIEPQIVEVMRGSRSENCSATAPAGTP